MAELMSVSEWAESEGMSRQAGHQAVKRCDIPVVNGKIDRLVASTLYHARTRTRMNTARIPSPSPGSHSTAPTGPDVGHELPAASAADHDLRRKKAEADMAELEAQRKASLLIAREPAERATFEAFRTLRDATFSACRSSAPMVLGLTDVRQIQHVLEDAQRSAFADFESAMQARLQLLSQP